MYNKISISIYNYNCTMTNHNATTLSEFFYTPRTERLHQKLTVELQQTHIYFMYMTMTAPYAHAKLFYYTPRIVAIVGGGEGPTDRRTLTQWPSERTSDELTRASPRVYIYIYLSLYRSGTRRGLQPATSGVMYIYIPWSSTTRRRIAITAVITATERVELLYTVFL